MRRVFPLGALRRERRALPLDARDFLGPRRGLLARGGRIRVGPVSPVGRRGESRLHLCRFHLPAHPLLPGRLLLRLEVSEPRALRAELLGGSDAFDLSFLQFRLEGCQPGLDFAEPARETIDVSRSLLGLATRVNQPAIRFALFGSRFKLGATRGLTPPTASSTRFAYEKRDKTEKHLRSRYNLNTTSNRNDKDNIN